MSDERKTFAGYGMTADGGIPFELTFKFVMKGGGKRGKRPITNFATNPKDSVEVLACLNFQRTDFDTFAAALNDGEFGMLKVYVNKDKNFDRVIDYVCGELAISQNFEAHTTT